MHEYPLAIRLRPRRGVRLPAADLSHADGEATDAHALRVLRKGIGQVLL
jgi:hypothetical protein